MAGETQREWLLGVVTGAGRLVDAESFPKPPFQRLHSS